MLTQHHQSNSIPAKPSLSKLTSTKTPHPGNSHIPAQNNRQQSHHPTSSTSPDPVKEPAPVSWFTYILVCLVLMAPIQEQYKTTIFLAGTAYFFVGAAAGLFGSLYTISTADRTINSYGLPTTRTNAAAHLSGVAGVGGVFVTQALIQIANLTYPGHLAQPFAFSLPNLLIAATFGLTPNLLIKNLQRQAEKSISDLESTKPSVIDKSSG